MSVARTAFSTSRLLDFVSEKELTLQCGYGRHDWALVVVKELVDNALDTGVFRQVRLDGQTIMVEDDGPGLPPGDLGRIFSLARPLLSSKVIRRPTRGALGNGLRVVTGAVVATGGHIDVATGGWRFR